MGDKTGVVAVISAFNPPEDLAGKVRRLLDQVDHVVVVDDGSSEDVTQTLTAIRQTGGVVVEQGVNAGIAAALNSGMALALLEWDPEWILTLDQDSELDPEYVDCALRAYAAAVARGVTVGIVCAVSHNGQPVMLQSKDSDFPEAFDPMQSGTLIHRDTLRRVGNFDESLFIDCVDSEYTARIREDGFRAIVAPGSNISHTLGQSRPMKIAGWHVKVFGKKRFVYYHAPFRVYYVTRNGLELYRRYALKQPLWVIRRMLLEVVFHSIRVLFGPHRIQHLYAFAFGIQDAAKRKLGKISERQAELLRPATK